MTAFAIDLVPFEIGNFLSAMTAKWPDYVSSLRNVVLAFFPPAALWLFFWLINLWLILLNNKLYHLHYIVTFFANLTTNNNIFLWYCLFPYLKLNWCYLTFAFPTNYEDVVSWPKTLTNQSTNLFLVACNWWTIDELFSWM